VKEEEERRDAEDEVHRTCGILYKLKKILADGPTRTAVYQKVISIASKSSD